MDLLTKQSIVALEKTNHTDDLLVCHRDLHQSIDWKIFKSECQIADILHGGLLFTTDRYFENLVLCAFNWSFLNPNPGSSSSSWKATSDFIFIKKGLISEIGGFDLSYQSMDSILSDFGFRALMSGARVRYTPHCLSVNNSTLQDRKKVDNIRQDEFLFIAKHCGAKLPLLVSLWTFFLEKLNFKILADYRDFKKKNIVRKSTPTNQHSYGFSLVSAKRQKTITSYSAIIPTLNRYAYLNKAIDSLIESATPPQEIIVIDQTPIDQRIEGYYGGYSPDMVKVIYLDKAGQASARNTGIKKAACDWIFLFDDDSIAWKDCINNHISLLENSHAYISTGASLWPTQKLDDITLNNRRYKITEVLDTGNCFLSKQVIEKINYLDVAFDHGSGVDDDLGKRFYLSGFEIIWNPNAIRTHYKATTGGLRTHGSFWLNQTSLWGGFPPPTQLYSIRKYYKRKYWLFLSLIVFLKARRRYKLNDYILLLILSPVKILKSIIKTRRLILDTEIVK